jgi:hypothetical protein
MLHTSQGRVSPLAFRRLDLRGDLVYGRARIAGVEGIAVGVKKRFQGNAALLRGVLEGADHAGMDARVSARNALRAWIRPA